MDNSHVALVSLQLNSAAFEPYRCDRNMYVQFTPACPLIRAAREKAALQVGRPSPCADEPAFTYTGR